MTDNPLGTITKYPDKYSPEVLYPIPRWPSRSLLDIDKKLLMYGFDCWRAYELSWLTKQGKPQCAIGEIYFDARSENMIESKSLKLYLNSLNNERFGDSGDFAETLRKDLTAASRSDVVVNIKSLIDPAVTILHEQPGMVINELDVEIDRYVPDAELLQCGDGNRNDDCLVCDLFRSNCPITGQPDWASCVVQYSGRAIEPESLLRYLCSFRDHQGYHEECAELIFRDIMLQCQPEVLVVGMNYTRRGGLEINPYRSNRPISPGVFPYRFARQ